ncbi:MAG TPA: hypothetical protein VNS58_02835 [Puia sp.]|nr:hypothetical protein [Puia sp.]
MKKQTIRSFVLFVVLGAGAWFGCKKSSSSPGSAVNKADLAGAWTRQYYISAGASGLDTVPVAYLNDTLQFTNTGKVYGIYFAQTYTTSGEVWVETADTGTYSLLNDTTLYINGRTYLYGLTGDTFHIRKLDAHQLELHTVNGGVSSDDYDTYIK